VLVFLTSAAFTYACAYFEINDFSRMIVFALLTWLAVTVPMAVAEGLYMKLDPMVVVAHLVSWGVKLAILAAAIRLIMPVPQR